MIKPQMTVCLGGGSNVSHLAEALSTANIPGLQLCTPSEFTAATCKRLGLNIRQPADFTTIDLAFDGCDSLDRNLNVLKSNGGIFATEKYCAQAAQEYIILCPAERVHEQLNWDIPLTLEVLPLVQNQITELLQQSGCRVTVRQATTMAGLTRTTNGNLLLDCWGPADQSVAQINALAVAQNGVVATSYFENLVTQVLTFDENDQVQTIRKDRE